MKYHNTIPTQSVFKSIHTIEKFRKGREIFQPGMDVVCLHLSIQAILHTLMDIRKAQPLGLCFDEISLF